VSGSCIGNCDIENDTFHIVSEKYNFDWSKTASLPRNIETWADGKYAGAGTEYTIRFNVHPGTADQSEGLLNTMGLNVVVTTGQ
jgi:hypothetical protein